MTRTEISIKESVERESLRINNYMKWGCMTKAFRRTATDFPDLQSHAKCIQLRIRSSAPKQTSKPRGLTHLEKIPLLRLRYRTSTEGNKSKKKQTYRITSKATQKRRSSSSCVDCLVQRTRVYFRAKFNIADVMQITDPFHSGLIQFTLGCSISCLYFWRSRRADHLIKSQNAKTLTGCNAKQFRTR